MDSELGGERAKVNSGTVLPVLPGLFRTRISRELVTTCARSCVVVRLPQIVCEVTGAVCASGGASVGFADLMVSPLRPFVPCEYPRTQAFSVRSRSGTQRRRSSSRRVLGGSGSLL